MFEDSLHAVMSSSAYLELSGLGIWWIAGSCHAMVFSSTSPCSDCNTETHLQHASTHMRLLATYLKGCLQTVMCHALSSLLTSDSDAMTIVCMH